MDPRRILVTDLDGTLLGDDAALARFRDWFTTRRSGHRLVYASGRRMGSVRRLIADAVLPEPDAIVSDVGTQVHDGSGARWPGWIEGFPGWTGDAVRDALREHRWLVPQADEHQSKLKASYDVAHLLPSHLGSIRCRLADAGITASLVYSGGLHLDVIPAEAGKGRATLFLAGCWSIATDDVLAFGDSGNDLELLSSGFRGTMVANALPELREAVPDTVYRSPEPFAAGVLDGIRYWTTGPKGVGRRQRRSGGQPVRVVLFPDRRSDPTGGPRRLSREPGPRAAPRLPKG